ncbi:MAG: hypothetical protein R3F04_16700 [Lysobacteraceae bacterium]
MLYHLHEFQRSLLSLVLAYAEATFEALHATGQLAVTGMPGASRIAAGFELFYRIGKDYVPEFGIRSVNAHGHDIPVVEYTALENPSAA